MFSLDNNDFNGIFFEVNLWKEVSSDLGNRQNVFSVIIITNERVNPLNLHSKSNFWALKRSMV